MAKANPFGKKGAADAKKGGKAPLPMKNAKPFIPKGGKGMVAPPARKAK